MQFLKKFINYFIFMNDHELVHSPAKPDMNAFAMQAVFGNIFMMMTGGTFLSGYLVYLGASDELVSYITLMPSILGIFLVFLSLLMQRYQKPRGVVLFVNGFAKFFLASIIFVPFFVSKQFAIPIVFFLYSIGHIFNSMNNLMINNWFIKSIPSDIRGRFFSVRQIISMILNSFLPILAGILVDKTPEKYHAFLILYCFAIIMAIFECFSFAKIRNCKLDIIETKLNIIDVIRIPIKNKPFMKFVGFLGLFYFFLYLSSALKQLYMIKYLNMSYTFINAMGMMSFILQAVILYRLWGRANDRLGSNFIMTTSIWFFALDLIFWFCATPSTAFFFLPMGHLMGAIQGPAFAIGSYNRRYEIIPEKGRSLYDAFFTSFIALVLIISPFLGGKIRYLIAQTAFSKSLVFGEIRIMYLISAILIIGMQIVYYLIIKKKQPDNPCLKKESYIGIVKSLFR